MANNNNNSNNNQGHGPFWDFIQSLQQDPNRAHEPGVGVDHAYSGSPFGAGFPFGGPESFNPWGGRGSWGGPSPWGEFPWGRGGRRGRHGRHHRRDASDSGRDENPEENNEEHDFDMAESPETMRDAPEGPPGPPPPGGSPRPYRGPPHHGPGPHHHGRHPFGGPGPFRRGGRGRCGPRGHHGHHGPPGPPPPFGGAFDFRPLMHALSSHPLAQGFQNYAEQARSGPQGATAEQEAEQDETFVPPVDIFNTEKSYILHVSLPGAVKEDVGVNWDAEKSVLNIAGVVYRPGNEEFLQTLSSSERKVGMFERCIKLPPPETDSKDEVDGFSITAKMENGILIVNVPKAEKEWTEIHKVDIE